MDAEDPHMNALSEQPHDVAHDASWRVGPIGALEEGFLQAEAITRHHARSFYFCSAILPWPKRRAAYATYAFCRYVDDAVDECEGDRDEAAARIDDIRVLLDRVYDRDPSLEPLWQAFAMTVAAWSIPRAYFEILIRGVAMDLEPARYETWEELEDYCFHVAGVVGLIMTCVFGTQPGVHLDDALERARHLGTAMQLTNILRDVHEDWGRGRVYLPAEDLRRFGVTTADLDRGQTNDAIEALMTFQIKRARHYYSLAEPGVPMLTDDGSRLTVLAMSRVYGGILDAIEAQDLDPFAGRAFTTTLTKLRLLTRAYAALTRLRLNERHPATP